MGIPKVAMIRGSDKPKKSFFLPQSVIDVLQKIFFVALLVTVGLIAYLFYGLFSGQMADASSGKTEDLRHAMELIQNVSNYLNISLVVTLITAVALFYEMEIAGIVMLIVAAALSYGIQFGIDFFDASGRYKHGGLSEMTLEVIRNVGVMVAVPGVLLFIRSLFVRIGEARLGPDLTTVQYGKNVVRQKSPGAALGALAKCWQLPYCREQIRVKCPIYHARTRCWKERVGCMCEENIIRLAMGGEENKSAEVQGSSGFVPIGDLIVKSEASTRAKVSTRPGPRGVRLPTNPHLSEGQKRERCRNCIIYNEHQRQKYNLLSPLIAISVPAIALLQFDEIRVWLGHALRSLDGLIAHLQFNQANAVNPGLAPAISDSLFVEGMLILCLTIMAVTWALKLLEFVTFKIKI